LVVRLRVVEGIENLCRYEALVVLVPCRLGRGCSSCKPA